MIVEQQKGLKISIWEFSEIPSYNHNIHQYDTD